MPNGNDGVKMELKILINEKDLKRLFNDNPTLKHEENHLYFEKGGKDGNKELDNRLR